MALQLCLICCTKYRVDAPRVATLPPLRIAACIGCREGIRRMAEAPGPRWLTPR